jgi:hypothetical protein
MCTTSALQVAAAQVFHRDVGDAGVFGGLVNGHDVRVVQPAGGARLAKKALAHVFKVGAGEPGGQRHGLDGNGLTAVGVDPEIHSAHGTAPELTLDAVAAQRAALAGRRRGYRIQAADPDAPRRACRYLPMASTNSAPAMPAPYLIMSVTTSLGT